MSIPVVNSALAILLLAIAIPSSAALTAEVGPPANRTLTLYADGQALVREQRAAQLERGRNRVVVRQLPRGIDTSSIRVAARGVTLAEVRDGLSVPDRLSTLSPAAQESALVPTRGGNGEAIGEWILEAEQRLEEPITVTYLVSGIQYSASLDVVLERQGGIQLDGWVSIRNGLGLAFDGARVVLVTTPARRTRHSNPSDPIPRREVELAERIALPAGQSRRLRVLDRQVEAQPERIVVEGGRLQKHEQALEVGQRMRQGGLGTQPVWAETRRRLDRQDLAAIVRVLPAATRRIYRENPLGPELLYEDTIDPASMSRELTLARATDLRVRRRQLQFAHRKDPRETEETLEIVVGNEGSKSVRVELVEHLFRSPNFEILASSRDLEAGAGEDAALARSVLTIDPGQQAKLTYTVLYRP